MNTKPTNFDINRHVLGIVDDEKKIVTIVLTCELHRAEEMFMKVVRSIAASYKGYEIVAPLFSINDKLNFALYANPIWKDTNDALLQKRVSFLRTRREPDIFVASYNWILHYITTLQWIENFTPLIKSIPPEFSICFKDVL